MCGLSLVAVEFLYVLCVLLHVLRCDVLFRQLVRSRDQIVDSLREVSEYVAYFLLALDGNAHVRQISKVERRVGDIVQLRAQLLAVLVDHFGRDDHRASLRGLIDGGEDLLVAREQHVVSLSVVRWIVGGLLLDELVDQSRQRSNVSRDTVDLLDGRLRMKGKEKNARRGCGVP